MGERTVPESSGDDGANGIERCAESFIVCVSAGFYIAEEMGPVEEVESVGAEIGAMYEKITVWCAHIHWVHENAVKGHEGHDAIHRNFIRGFLSGPTFRRHTTVIRFPSRFCFPLCRWLYTLRTHHHERAEFSEWSFVCGNVRVQLTPRGRMGLSYVHASP